MKASSSRDAGECKHDLDLAIKVGVQHTQNVLKVRLIHDHRPARLSKAGHGERRGLASERAHSTPPRMKL